MPDKEGDSAVKWTDTRISLPPMTDSTMFTSDEVLCQDIRENTFLGCVRYDPDDRSGEYPYWAESGRDMYDLPDITRWINLVDVLCQIQE